MLDSSQALMRIDCEGKYASDHKRYIIIVQHVHSLYKL